MTQQSHRFEKLKKPARKLAGSLFAKNLNVCFTVKVCFDYGSQSEGGQMKRILKLGGAFLVVLVGAAIIGLKTPPPERTIGDRIRF